MHSSEWLLSLCVLANRWYYSACITSMIRLKYIVAYGTSVDVTCKLSLFVCELVLIANAFNRRQRRRYFVERG